MLTLLNQVAYSFNVLWGAWKIRVWPGGLGNFSLSVVFL